jgi:hypothetical protein
LLTCQHCILAIIVEEVSAQSCHHSLTAVKNSRRTKDVGGVGNNQSIRQIFGTNRRGSQTRNQQREYGQRKCKWGGMISSTLQTQENKISLQSTIERLGKTATVVKLHLKTD